MSATNASMYTFASRSDMRFEDAWRPLDRAVACWVRAHAGSPTLAALGAWASFADGEGHSALSLLGGSGSPMAMPSLDAERRRIVEGDALVTVVADDETSSPATPFVIDGDHFLLRRNFLNEVAVAEQIARRRAGVPAGIADADWVDELFGGDDDASVQLQREAVARVVGRRFFVLTGAPGTGKTTTVLRMLAMLARDWQSRSVDVQPVIRVSAPTGKAAQRIAQSLRVGAQRLCEGTNALPDAWRPAIERARSAQASTLHRLLGSTGRGGFRHHRGNPLPADIVIVDEASMIDLSLLRCLLDALRDDTLLVLVGDADQLTSVATGSVLRDIVNALAGEPDLVRLTHSFRADRSLVPLNESIRAGDVAAFRAACDDAGERVALVPLASTQVLQRELVRWGRDLHRHLRRIGAFGTIDHENEALAVLDAVRDRQFLCALRETQWGADAVNDALERMIHAELDELIDGRWYRGRMIMITTNDYSCGLYNGDVGVCLGDSESGFKVWFEADALGGNGELAPKRRAVSLAIGSLPAHQGAFAITIHKSQGSEYGHVAVLLPGDTDNPILSRELLYTGVSRARYSLQIWGRREIVECALLRPVQRAGLLERRMRARRNG